MVEAIRHPINCQACGFVGTVNFYREDDETWLSDCPDCDRTHAANFATDEDEGCTDCGTVGHDNCLSGGEYPRPWRVTSGVGGLAAVVDARNGIVAGPFTSALLAHVWLDKWPNPTPPCYWSSVAEAVPETAEPPAGQACPECATYYRVHQVWCKRN